MKKIVFVTGTRADYSKQKSIIKLLQRDKKYHVDVFVTGMHMLEKYGYTVNELVKNNIQNVYKYQNCTEDDFADHVLAKTIFGLSGYLDMQKPDCVIIHGDRIETLAAAICCNTKNILCAHIEGGEQSGSVDNHYRNAISRLAHIHFVTNHRAKKNLIISGEEEERIYVVGSPDIDIISKNNIAISQAKKRYKIKFNKYSIAIYHPVSTEYKNAKDNVIKFINALIKSKKKYILIYPNNDLGNKEIFSVYQEKKLEMNQNFAIFPSLRLEYLLCLLENAEFIIGNSSAGIMEAPYFGTPTINIGTRQQNRINNMEYKSIINCSYETKDIVNCIKKIKDVKFSLTKLFGVGESAKEIKRLLDNDVLYNTKLQKKIIYARLENKYEL